MASTSSLPLADRLIPGGAKQFLAEARAKGQPARVIAERLKAEHDITVSYGTVLNWCRELGIEKAAADV